MVTPLPDTHTSSPILSQMHKYLITDISFDFTDDNFELPPRMQLELYSKFTNNIFTADNDDDLVDSITTQAGFCINSINYRQLPEYIK